jgi:glycosyltransferase involved in cell wall biosynthesis
MEQLKVLTLATSLNGGAGIAARRTHESLADAGVDSHLIVVKSQEEIDDPLVRKVENSQFFNLLSRTNTVFQRSIFQNSNRLVTPISVGTFNRSGIELKNPDVIHIHAFYNMFTTKEIWKIGQQFPKSKIAVTLHDERLFTGGCHYSGDCKKFESKCKKCPQTSSVGNFFVEKSHKVSLRMNTEDYKIITPSVWLAEQARRSSVLRKNQIYTLSNPVPKIFFNQYTKERKASEFNVAFISQDLGNPYKGIKTIIDAVLRLDSKTPSRRIVMNFVGRGDIAIATTNIQIRTFPIDSEEEMAGLLSKMNLVVLASTEDNMPNVILESLAAGVRVLGTNIGGIPEILKKFSLDVFSPGDSNTLSKLILKEFNLDFQRPNPLRASEFDYSNVSKKLIDIYLS